ncbi:uncharacterized protein LOC103483941 isoform X2 [Cucumis melo]|uniref:Uncharacterized protein LOC103483941 isoform X2 n=1 Tax=Cucumis melo TaxID=3656 RepID=A0A1S3AXT9_CUCME|nr:uncharacterized protein LOC103483941 isoform X2 [Cucumis melo]
MAKFNVVQKQRRAVRAQIKRDAHGDPLTKKLKIKQQPTYVSNKRKRKLMKKKRREEKEALQMGLTNMEDVEMAVAEAKDSPQILEAIGRIFIPGEWVNCHDKWRTFLLDGRAV